MAARHASPIQTLLTDPSFDADVSFDEPMARHTTYKIGGPARYFVRVGSISALSSLVNSCEVNEVPWIMVGRGSNLLVSDTGYDGAVITLGPGFRSLQVNAEDLRFSVGAGANLSAVVQEAFGRNLGGFEFAVGTPGTIGGALRMNAGSASEWIGQRVVSVTTFHSDRGLRLHTASEILWEYRRSSIDPDEIILECELQAVADDPLLIHSRMEANLARRKREQPLSQPSCGSVFRNPPEASAGSLIEQCGLKGLQRGGALVSPVHANFIVNTGSATASDVRFLMETVQRKVLETYGIELKPEVRFLGFV